MMTLSFEKLAGKAAFLAGIAGFLYAYSFIILSRSDPETGALLSAFFLLAQGLLLTKVYVAVYQRVSPRHPSVALWALFLGMAGALGMGIHGGYDLANILNPPLENLPALANLPSQVDPRGLMTFGVGGIALFAFSWLMSKTKGFPQGLALVGYTSAILSMTLFVGRLVILTPASPIILWPALINGFVIGPVLYLWLGLVLWKELRG